MADWYLHISFVGQAASTMMLLVFGTGGGSSSLDSDRESKNNRKAEQRSKFKANHGYCIERLKRDERVRRAWY